MKGFFLPILLIALGIYLWPESQKNLEGRLKSHSTSNKTTSVANAEKESLSYERTIKTLKVPTRPQTPSNKLQANLKVEDAMTLMERLAKEWRKIADNHYRYDLQLPPETLDEIHSIAEELSRSIPFEFDGESEEEIREIVTEYYESHEKRYHDALKTLLNPEEFASIEERRQSYNQWISKAYPQLQGYEITYY